MYDYNHYNLPEQGNKHIYAYGDNGDSLASCGFIYADNLSQATTVLNAHNCAWECDYVLLDYNETDCHAEVERRQKNIKN